MERRKFLASSLAASALAVTATSGTLDAAQGSATMKGREFYQLRRYHINGGPQRKLCDDFFRDALIPALNRLSISPVGVFDVLIGPETPSIYVLMPSMSLETVATIESRLAQDAEYMKVGAPFLNAPAKEPAFDRMESSLLHAFEKWPKLIPPAATAKNGSRVFEIRIYEGATDQDHKRKVEMMQSGESEIFNKAGVEQVFYSDTLSGRVCRISPICWRSIAWPTAKRNGRYSARRMIGRRIRTCRNMRLRPSCPTSTTTC